MWQFNEWIIPHYLTHHDSSFISGLIEESESLFHYNMTGAGDTFASFQHLDFAPTLVSDNVDELLSELNNTGKMAVGSELCGDNVACLQDFLVTGSNDTASETKGVQVDMEETHGILGRMLIILTPSLP